MRTQPLHLTLAAVAFVAACTGAPSRSGAQSMGTLEAGGGEGAGVNFCNHASRIVHVSVRLAQGTPLRFDLPARSATCHYALVSGPTMTIESMADAGGRETAILKPVVVTLRYPYPVVAYNTKRACSIAAHNNVCIPVPDH